MALRFLTLLGVVSCDLASGDAPSKMPNIGYAAGGYNVFYGNPRSTQVGVDPGFSSLSSIFQMNYADATTGDGRYLVPKGFTIKGDTGCTLEFSADATFKSSDYSSTLKTSVSADFSSFPASFTASVDFKAFQARTTNSSMRSVSSVAHCSVYDAIINRYEIPPYTDDFNAALAQLPADYGDGEKYFDLIDAYGTHAVASIQMGSRYGFSSFMTETQWTTVSQTGVDVKVAATYEGEVKAGGSLNTSVQKDQQQTFDQNSQFYEVITLGAKPTDGNVITWTQQAVADPMPIKYSLRLLCDVIMDDAHAALKANCEKALTPSEYCSKRLLSRKHHVSSCDAPLDNACIWLTDCGPAQECLNNMCVSPSGSGSVVAINRYWDVDDKDSTFHPPPAWANEHIAGENTFYAFSRQVADSTPVNRYWNENDRDSTFHPSPAWPNEHNAGDAMFYAFTSQRPGTVAINRYWNDDDRDSTFHPAPEWPNEHDEGDKIFYAYAAPATCSAHASCSTDLSAQGINVDADCCPTKAGVWLRCCDAARMESTSLMQVLV